MTQPRWSIAAALIAFVAIALWVAAPGLTSAQQAPGGHQHDPAPAQASKQGAPAKDGHDHVHGDDKGAMGGHTHAEVPPEYQKIQIPASAWTNPQTIARGKMIYAEKCAVCHGEQGDGKGPAGVALPLRPPDMGNAAMINAMPGPYWFWRVSEGGAVQPFVSQGSVMPAWKTALPVEDRWAVIAYQHTFSRHKGPHVASEHPEMLAAEAGHPGGDKPALGTTAAAPAHDMKSMPGMSSPAARSNAPPKDDTKSAMPGMPGMKQAAPAPATPTEPQAASMPAGMMPMDMCRQMMMGANMMGMSPSPDGHPMDPAMMGHMMEMRGDMMKAMGDVMIKHARKLQDMPGMKH